MYENTIEKVSKDTFLGYYCPIESDNWNGNSCIKCITGQNGITIIDLQIDDETSKHFNGWFINMNNKVLDSFQKSDLP